MRPELEFIARIEEYLNGSLSAENQLIFEKRLARDQKLQEEVALQKDLMEGIKSHGIRYNIRMAKRKYLLRKKAIKLGIVGGILVLTAVAGLYLFQKNQEQHESLPPLPEQQDMLDAAIDLEEQVFVVPANENSIIETREGIVFAIPENGFQSDSDEEITITVKEALTPFSIITSGLSTTSNGQLLETAGMFKIEASQNGQRLTLQEGKEILVDMPANNDALNMMLFDGELTENGGINWVDPAPIENFLTTVDINSLDFYPSNFLDSLHEKGYDIQDKNITDSVFYSFYSNMAFAPFLDDQKALVASAESVVVPIAISSSNSTPVNYPKDTLESFKIETEPLDVREEVDYAGEDAAYAGIEPADVKAIWNEKFQNTFIATREFEKRMPLFYHKNNFNLLSIYTSNLDKPLYYCDSLAALKGEGVCMEGLQQVFERAYSRKDGRVKIDDQLAKELSNYFEEKRAIYQSALEETYSKWVKEQHDLNAVQLRIQQKKWKHQVARQRGNYSQEIRINLDEAYRQLGKERTPTRIVRGESLRFAVNSTGWKNVDRYVAEATANRTTLDYTDPITGKKAVIKYEPISIQVNGVIDPDKQHVYLVSDNQYSFRKLSAKDGFYEEKLNELLSYHVMAVAYKDDQCFVADLQNCKPGQHSLTFSQTTEAELDRIINSMCGFQAAKDMKIDLRISKALLRHEKRNKRNAATAEEQRAFYPTIFKCWTRWGARPSDVAESN